LVRSPSQPDPWVGYPKDTEPACRELLETEKAYTEALESIVKNMLVPLRRMQSLTEEELTRTFGNIEAIYSVTIKLVAALEASGSTPMPAAIGKAFITRHYLFQDYFKYCHNYASLTVRDLLRCSDFLLDLRSRAKSTIPDLRSFLIKPVQRIMRYPLLLRAILKTLPQESPECATVEKALRLMESVNVSINRKMDGQPAIAMVRLLQEWGDQWHQAILTTTRRLVLQFECTLTIHTGGHDAVEGQRGVGYLFGDALLLCVASRRHLLAGEQMAPFVLERRANLSFDEPAWIQAQEQKQALRRYSAALPAVIGGGGSNDGPAHGLVVRVRRHGHVDEAIGVGIWQREALDKMLDAMREAHADWLEAESFNGSSPLRGPQLQEVTFDLLAAMLHAQRLSTPLSSNPQGDKAAKKRVSMGSSRISSATEPSLRQSNQQLSHRTTSNLSSTTTPAPPPTNPTPPIAEVHPSLDPPAGALAASGGDLGTRTRTAHKLVPVKAEVGVEAVGQQSVCCCLVQ